MSRLAAAKYMKKSKSFVTKWTNRYLEVKNVDDLPGRGPEKKTSPKQDKKILDLFATKPGLSLRKAKEVVEKSGVQISVETIRKRLGANDVKYRSSLKKPLLSSSHVEKRLAWACANSERNWNNVIFTDESSFWANSNINRSWCTANNRLLQRTVKHPVKVHVWGCFSEKGFGRLFVFTSNLNAVLMNKIYQTALLPSAAKMFGRRGHSWILQEDNDPKHRSRMCAEWKQQNGVEVLDWPSQSPDANPIENVWAIVKQKLRGKTIWTAKQLSRQIRLIWKRLPRQLAQNLVQSMSRRCEAIIANGGDYTCY